MDFGTIGFVRHNGGNDNKQNMKMNVVFVMLLKVKGQCYNENIVTVRVILVYACCLHIARCVENVQIKENVFVKMKCEVSCLNWI
jgi:hypothetical protein